jgi:hypothetical protein
MTRKKIPPSSLPEALRHPAVGEPHPSPSDLPSVNPYARSPEEMFEILRRAKILTKTGRLAKVFR